MIKIIFLIILVLFIGCSSFEDKVTISQVIIFDEELFTIYSSQTPRGPMRGDIAIVGLLHTRGRVFPITVFGKQDEHTDKVIDNIGRSLPVKEWEKLISN